jgi:hypothetical protein
VKPYIKKGVKVPLSDSERVHFDQIAGVLVTLGDGQFQVQGSTYKNVEYVPGMTYALFDEVSAYDPVWRWNGGLKNSDIHATWAEGSYGGEINLVNLNHPGQRFFMHPMERSA